MSFGFAAPSAWSPNVRVASAGLLLLSLLWGALLWDLQRHVDAVHTSTRQEIETISQISAKALLFTLRSIDVIVLDLATHWQANSSSFDQEVRRRQAQADIGIKFDIAVVGADGRLVYSSRNPAAVGMDVSDRLYYTRYRDNSDYDDLLITGPIHGRLTNRMTIQFARPLRNATDRTDGVVVFSVTPDYLSQSVRSVEFPEGTVMTVLGGEGTVLLRTVARATVPADHAERADESSQAGDERPMRIPTPPQLGLPESGYARVASPVDGVVRMWGWERIAPYRLTLLVGRPVSIVDDAIRELRLRYYGVGVLCSLALLAALYGQLLSLRTRAQAAARQAEHIAQLTRREAELRGSQRELRRLAGHQIALKEEERKHFAREIHDELGQRLTVLRMDVSMLPRAVGADPAGMLPGQVAALKAGIDGVMAVVREIAGTLRPAALEIGLEPAVEQLVEDFRTSVGIPCVFANGLPRGFALDDTRATAIFRIVQESLTNVARHAAASRVRIALAVEGGSLRLQVQDDGVGLDPKSQSRNPSFGLSGMRERAAMLGGSLKVRSKQGNGTTVEARIPLAGSAPAARAKSEDVPKAQGSRD